MLYENVSHLTNEELKALSNLELAEKSLKKLIAKKKADAMVIPADISASLQELYACTGCDMSGKTFEGLMEAISDFGALSKPVEDKTAFFNASRDLFYRMLVYLEG